jgi:hypothetical protein
VGENSKVGGRMGFDMAWWKCHGWDWRCCDNRFVTDMVCVIAVSLVLWCDCLVVCQWITHVDLYTHWD